MRFQNLANVHSLGYAQRVQHQVHGLTVVVERHVLDRHDHGDHALVAVTPGHLVARLNAPLDGQIHLDHLQHARRQIIAAL